MATADSFEQNVRAGYYEKQPGEWNGDFCAFLKSEGVPEQYVSGVASYAYQHGHSSGYCEVLNVSYDLIELFKGAGVSK